MSKPTLKERLQGTWRLEEYIALPTPASAVQRPTYPMTKDLSGLLMYTSDGYMSAQLLIPGQMGFDGTSDAQWAETGKRSFTYAGPFYITEEGPDGAEVLRHSSEVCILPDRVGELEIPTYRFEEDDQVLVLGGEETMIIKGDKRIPVLRWRRVKDNTGVRPPPPLPEISLGDKAVRFV